RSIVGYMRGRWGLSEDRFIVRSTDRPSLVSNEQYVQGIEENRRVELSSNDGSVLDPVVHTRFNEYVPVQPHHDFAVNVANPEQSSSWALKVNHHNRDIGARAGTEAPPAQISFDLSQEMTDRLAASASSFLILTEQTFRIKTKR
ncbi:MAG: hypothetical protein NTX15_05130, partial [Candidatus Kapabacteria bacterium]|nr:hypothetical protein [Candidatus Kapabacteria bacterium]